MKILIEIPEEYEQEYEIETLLMLCESFKNSKTVTFVEHSVLEKFNYGLFKNDAKRG